MSKKVKMNIDDSGKLTGFKIITELLSGDEVDGYATEEYEKLNTGESRIHTYRSDIQGNIVKSAKQEKDSEMLHDEGAYITSPYIVSREDTIRKLKSISDDHSIAEMSINEGVKTSLNSVIRKDGDKVPGVIQRLTEIIADEEAKPKGEISLVKIPNALLSIKSLGMN